MAQEKVIQEPRLYNFVLSPEMSDSVLCWGLEKFQVAKSNFATLLDHTLAVIWHSFSNDGAELTCMNKADIVWALRFLEAIDTSKITETTDLDALIDFFRKTLITLYALEDETSFLNETKSMYDQIGKNHKLNSSALEDFLSSVDIQEELQQVKECEPSTNCNDAEFLDRLQRINPEIKSIEDIKNWVPKEPTNIVGPAGNIEDQVADE